MLESTDRDESIIRALSAGCVRTCARVITRIENGEEGLEPLLRSLYMAGGAGKIVGITGPPGAGKSTLIGKLVGTWRRRGYRVAVLAIDPSSPFTGGAILGDRLRMVAHCADDGVFIRSMASRGQLGGLAKTSGDVLMVLGAMPWDFIIVETVGAGQNETDIMHHASVVALVLTPMGGDDIQTAKAGINEIGDIYVVNKGDHPDADNVCRQLKEMVAIGYQLNPDPKLRPSVLKTQSLKGEGIENLADEIERRFSTLAKNPALKKSRLKEQIKYRIRDIVLETVMRRVQAESGLADSLLDSVITRESDPYDLAMKFFPELNRIDKTESNQNAVDRIQASTAKLVFDGHDHP